VLVTKFVFSYNPQITKARIFNKFKSNITLNSGLSMLVGISEAICLLFFVLAGRAKRALPAPRSKKSRSLWIFFFQTSINGCHFLSFFNTLCFGTQYNKNFSSCSGLFYVRINRRKSGDSRLNNRQSNDSNKIFNQWLAGLIDGDGCFQLSKKGYASLEIVMETRDKHCLYQIKQKFGGSVKLRSGVNWLRYRLHHKKGLLDLIHAVNGEIRNPIRLLQLNKICQLYNIPVIQPSPLTYNNGWLSGFFDSDGSIHLNLKSSQICITASQKK